MAAAAGNSIRSRKAITVFVAGEEYQAEVVEIPFREGVELRCKIGDEEIRISDRQLGEHEALRLLAEEIERRRKAEP